MREACKTCSPNDCEEFSCVRKQDFVAKRYNPNCPNKNDNGHSKNLDPRFDVTMCSQAVVFDTKVGENGKPVEDIRIRRCNLPCDITRS